MSLPFAGRDIECQLVHDGGIVERAFMQRAARDFGDGAGGGDWEDSESGGGGGEGVCGAAGCCELLAISF